MARKNHGNGINGLAEIGMEGFATLEWEERYGGGSRSTTTTRSTPPPVAVQPPPTPYWWNNYRRLPGNPKSVSPHDITTTTTTTTYYSHFVPTPAKEMAISTIDCDQAAMKYNGVLIKESAAANYKRKPATSFFSNLRRGYY